MLDVECDVVFSGDLLKNNNSIINKMITEYILNHSKNKTIVNAKFHPVVGACIMGILNKTGSFEKDKLQNALTTCEWFGLDRC